MPVTRTSHWTVATRSTANAPNRYFFAITFGSSTSSFSLSTSPAEVDEDVGIEEKVQDKVDLAVDAVGARHLRDLEWHPDHVVHDQQADDREPHLEEGRVGQDEEGGVRILLVTPQLLLRLGLEVVEDPREGGAPWRLPDVCILRNAPHPHHGARARRLQEVKVAVVVVVPSGSTTTAVCTFDLGTADLSFASVEGCFICMSYVFASSIVFTHTQAFAQHSVRGQAGGTDTQEASAVTHNPPSGGGPLPLSH